VTLTEGRLWAAARTEDRLCLHVPGTILGNDAAVTLKKSYGSGADRNRLCLHVPGTILGNDAAVTLKKSYGSGADRNRLCLHVPGTILGNDAAVTLKKCMAATRTGTGCACLTNAGARSMMKKIHRQEGSS
jgi:hypothetical protein